MTWNFIAGCDKTQVARARATMIVASAAGQQHDTDNSQLFRDSTRDVLATSGLRLAVKFFEGQRAGLMW